MTVNTEIGHHVSPFCPRAHCWRTSADNLPAQRTLECGSCQRLSTKGKFIKRETCVRDISEALNLALNLFATYIHIYYIHTYSHSSEQNGGTGEAARISERIDRVSPRFTDPVGIRNGAARMCTYYVPGGDVTASAPPSGRPARPPRVSHPLLAERGQSRRFDPRPASHSVVSV